MATDLVLINPGNRTQVYQSLGPDLTAIEPPIWCGLIATFARRHGFDVRIIDANAEDLDPRETAERLRELNPLLTAVVAYGHNPSASTQVMPAAGAVCRAVRQSLPATRILLLGGHVAALPERTLREEECDFVCSGEGPITVLELLQALKVVNPDLRRVRSVLFRDAAGVVQTEPAPLVTDLDGDMPGMAWDLLPMERYRAHNWHCFGFLDQRMPYASLYTSLGCPFNCSYCAIQAPFRTGEQAMGLRGHSYRMWGADAVLAQLDMLVRRYGVRNVKFADEIFVLNAQHVNGICDGIIERGYDLNIWAYARVDTMRDDAMLARLKKAGVHWLALGIESASRRVRNDVRKRFDQDAVYSAVERARAHGIHILGNYILGLPEDDAQSMQETLDLAMDLNCEFFNIYCAMAYPGSELYETALREKWPLPASWSGYSQHSVDALPLPTRHLSGAEVLRFRDRAFELYFTNPRYLDMIARTFGEETARYVREMASRKLVRKNA